MITKKDAGFDLTHNHGGNGYAVVQWLPQEYCRVVSVGLDKIGDRAFLAWTKFLKRTRVLQDPDNRNSPSVDLALKPEIKAMVDALTDDLHSGKKVVTSQRIVSSVSP